MEAIYTVRIAQHADHKFAKIISETIADANGDTDNGICKRSEEFLQQKITEGEAVIAIDNQNNWVGFCYIQKWEDDFVSCCALIVHPSYRNEKIAKELKEKAVEMTRIKYPSSKLF